MYLRKYALQKKNIQIRQNCTLGQPKVFTKSRQKSEILNISSNIHQLWNVPNEPINGRFLFREKDEPDLKAREKGKSEQQPWEQFLKRF